MIDHESEGKYGKLVMIFLPGVSNEVVAFATPASRIHVGKNPLNTVEGPVGNRFVT